MAGDSTEREIEVSSNELDALKAVAKLKIICTTKVFWQLWICANLEAKGQWDVLPWDTA